LAQSLLLTSKFENDATKLAPLWQLSTSVFKFQCTPYKHLVLKSVTKTWRTWQK